MSRSTGIAWIGMLVGALVAHVVSASILPLADSRFDLRPALFARVFGEATDFRFGTVAGYADGTRDSFLRGAELRVALRPNIAVQNRQPLVVLSDVSNQLYAPVVTSASIVSAERALNASAAANVQQPLLDLYQSPRPSASYVATAGSFGIDQHARSATDRQPILTFTPIFSPVYAFDGSISGAAPVAAYATNQHAELSVPVALRMGKMRLQTRFEGAQDQNPQLALRDQASGVGANFDVRAGSRRVNVDLDTRFEHLVRNDGTPLVSSNFDGTSTLELPTGGSPVLVPAFADVSKRTISTGVAVPVTHNITLGVRYDTQHMQGGYGTPGLSNLDARNNTYGAKLTYALPHSASAITFSAKQYRYQDNLLPANTFIQTGANVNFTVKF